MLKIELRRCVTPEEAGEKSCAMCGTRFRVGGVYACPMNGNDLMDEREYAACTGCVAYFGERDPERFPTLEEYEEAARRHTDPLCRSIDEVIGRERAGTMGEIHAAEIIRS